MQKEKARLPQLDGIRGLAVLMVVWWHYFNCQLGVSASSPGWKFYSWQATSLFWSGVDLFFVLSGFLITGILLDHSKARNLFPAFFLRRAVRILPLYFLVLALAGIAFLALGELPQFNRLFRNFPPVSSFLTFTQNIVMGAQGSYGGRFLGMTWSLAVEEQFYLVWPLLILLCRKPRTLLVMSGILCVAAPCLRFVSGYLVGMVNMPHRMDSLLFGAIAAMLVRNQRFVAVVRERPRHFWFALSVLVPSVAVMAWFRGILGVLDHFVLGILFTVILLQIVIHTNGRLARLLCVPWLGQIGVISYGLYMFHEPIAGLLHGAILGAPPSLETRAGVLLTLFSFGLAVLAAMLSMRFFESRFLQWGHRFKYRSGEQEESPQRSLDPSPACASLG